MAVPIMFQPLVKYADFNGRARRQEFWLFWLFQRLLTYAVSIVLGIMTPMASYSSGNPEAYLNNAMPTYSLLALIGLVLFIPNLAVGVRRLHDINRTGWWLALPLGCLTLGIVIAVGMLVGNATTLDSMKSETTAMAVIGGMAIAFVPAVIGAIVLFVFNVLDGTPGSNRFGPDPKGRGVEAAKFF